MASAAKLTNLPSVGNCFNQHCPSRAVLAHVTGRWGSLVLGALQDGTQRYSEIRRRVGGISEKMLAKTLDELARDGLVERTSYPVVPPRVEYALTPLGRDLAQRIGSLITWINENVAEMTTLQEAHDVASRAQQPS